MRTACALVFATGVMFALATPALGQTAPAPAPPPAPATRPVGLSGPRFGVTSLSRSIRRKLADDEGIDVGALISQFGWQFEKQFKTSENGPALVTEWVLLVGGAEQGEFLPSVSWLIGMRTMKGVEFGVGPNITPVGAALVAAAGVTFRAGGLNLPVNLAVVPTKVKRFTYGGPPSFTTTEIKESGLRVTLLFGFNTRR